MLSTRSLNVFKIKFNNSDESMWKYYQENGDFLEIRNVGRKANKELIDYIEAKYHKRKPENNFTEVSLDLIKDLDKSSIDFIADEFNLDLNEATPSCLENWLLSESDIHKKYLVSDTIKAITEKGLKEYILNTILNEDNFEKASRISNKWSLVLFIFNHLFRKKFGNRDKKIIASQLNYWDEFGDYQSLEKTGNEVGLTRERVRQIKKAFLRNFGKNFNDLKKLKYFINEDELIKVNARLIFKINNDNIKLEYLVDNNYNHLLLVKLFSLIYNTYELLGSEVNYHRKDRARNNLDLKGVYLVNKEISKLIDLKKLILDVENRLHNKRMKKRKVDLNLLINKYGSGLSYSKMKAVRNELLIFFQDEFDISIDLEGMLVLDRNTSMRKYEYVYGVLKDLEPKQMGYHISELKKIIENKYGLSFDEDTIRSAVINNDIFIFFGRESSYGLKEWEETCEFIKGGTIRTIVEDFLKIKGHPVHISYIIKEVKKYRDTNASNVSRNLKQDESNLFHFYHGGYIGLKSQFDYDFEENRINPYYFSLEYLSKYMPAKLDDFLTDFINEHHMRKERLLDILIKKVESGILNLDAEILYVPNEKNNQATIKNTKSNAT